VLPRCNTQGMALHLAEVSAAVAPGAHAVVLLDQAGWHGSVALAVPDNITLMPLPAKCPELNPQENVWQFMRDNWLSNRVFTSYDNILDHCCYAWNRLANQPWRIMSRNCSPPLPGMIGRLAGSGRPFRLDAVTVIPIHRFHGSPISPRPLQG